MLNLAFFDSESIKLAQDFPDGWGVEVPNPFGKPWTQSNVPLMQFGMGCIYDNDGIRFYSDPMECLQTLLSPSVDAVVTFNGEGFDFHLLLGSIEPPEGSGAALKFGDGYLETYEALQAKSIDVLKVVTQAIGHRIKLDQLTSVLFDRKKEIDPVKWWPMYNGTPEQRVVAINYLLGDVMQLYKVYAVGHELGELAFRDNLGVLKKFSVKMPTVNDLKKV